MQGFGVSPEKRLVLGLPLLLQFPLLTAFVTRCDGTPETACLLLMLPLQQDVWNEALKVPKNFRVKFVHQERLLAGELCTQVGGVHKSSDAAKAWGQLEGWGFRKQATKNIVTVITKVFWKAFWWLEPGVSVPDFPMCCSSLYKEGVLLAVSGFWAPQSSFRVDFFTNAGIE